MSESYQSSTHSKWDCKYHVVFIPKRRRKAIFGNIRKELGPIFHKLARQIECPIVEGHLMPDHVHICIEIPPKYAVASVIGFIKGKSALAIARRFGGKERNCIGDNLRPLNSLPYSPSSSSWNVGIKCNRRIHRADCT